MFCTIPIILSSLTLNLLAISSTANGYPVRALTLNINHTHIPFPVFLLPRPDSASASALTNGKAPPTTTAVAVATATATSSPTVIISGRANDTEAGIKQPTPPSKSSSSADQGPPAQAVRTLKTKSQQLAELGAAARAHLHEILDFLRKDPLIIKLKGWGLDFFNGAMDLIGLGGLYPPPGGSGERSRPPAKVQKEGVQTRRGIPAAVGAVGADMGEERDGEK